jgi:hypothetical protein
LHFIWGLEKGLVAQRLSESNKSDMSPKATLPGKAGKGPSDFSVLEGGNRGADKRSKGEERP